MSQLTASMETQCIGRYLAELPKNFHWMNPSLTLYYGTDENFKTLEVQVPEQHTTIEAFSRRVDDIKNDISRNFLFENQSKSVLIGVKKENIHHGVMINYYSDPSGIGVDHQLHLLIGHTHVLIKGSSFEGSSTNSDEMSPAVEARMLELAEHIRAVTDPEKAGPGFCLGAAVVDSDNDFENADMTFEMAGHTDVTVGIWMDNQSNAPDTLRDRMSAFGSAADGKHLTILRSGDLILAGIPAQEVLVRIVDDGRTEFHFVIESRPKRPSLLEEGINMRLTTGGQLSDGRYVDSSLTQNEALALWDDMVKSFKPRPGAVRASSAHK